MNYAIEPRRAMHVDGGNEAGNRDAVETETAKSGNAARAFTHRREAGRSRGIYST